MQSFPSVTIGGITFSRVLIGINSVLGYSHTSSGRDRWIKRYYTTDRIAVLFSRCIELGLTGVFGPDLPQLIEAIDLAERRTGVRLAYLATVKGNAAEVRDQLALLQDVRPAMALVFGHTTDDWPTSGGQLVGFREHVSAIRQAGFTTGVVCHDGERLEMVQATGCEDASVYVIPINKGGFYMRPSREAVLRAVDAADRPVIAIKPLASGRFDERRIGEWLTWTFDVKHVEAVAVGFMSEEEAEEDVAIALQVLSRSAHV